MKSIIKLRKNASVIFASLVLLLFSLGDIDAIAELYRLDFEGVVSSVSGDFTGIEVNQQVSGYYMFESETSADYIDEEFASYLFTNKPDSFYMKVEINNQYWETEECDTQPYNTEILILNDTTFKGITVPSDRYWVDANRSTISAATPGCGTHLSIVLTASDNLSAITDTSLPAVPDFSSFETKELIIKKRGITPQLQQITVNLTSLTSPMPEALLEDLISDVVSVNIASGISNSLDSKLDAAVAALDDQNSQNDVATINALLAFINSVEAQRGKKISESDANELIDSAQAIIDLLTTTNQPPVAVAGIYPTVFGATQVQLDGGASNDPDGDIITFSWEFISVPEGSFAVLIDPTSATPSFIADSGGDYQIRLTVSDGVNSSSDETTITVMPSDEVCDSIDNDFDNLIDESIDGRWDDVGESCSDCIGGYPCIMQCNPLEPSGSTVCDVAPSYWGCDPNNIFDEICDGLDNDCNGDIDDGPLWYNLGETCYASDGTPGVMVCNENDPAGQAICNAVPAPTLGD